MERHGPLPSPEDSFRTRFPTNVFATMLAVVLCCGCHMAGSRYRPTPLSTLEQRQEIEKLVPLGTSRSEVESRLKEAGIELSPGASQRIAYCDIWNRTGGERWDLNVALLFDEAGKLVETRPAQAETGILSDSLATQTPPQPNRQTSLATASRFETGNAMTAADPRVDSANSPTDSPSESSPRDRRTPFETPQPAYAP